MQDKYIVFQIDGGIGKSIIATAVCAAIKKQFPKHKLIVITGYPEVFLLNPDVDVKLGFGELSYFYEKYVEGHENENKYFLLNPYLTTDFINHKGHLIQVWCEMFGIQYNGEKPKLYLNQREIDFYSKYYNTQKPILAIHTNGGAPNQPNKYSWARDLPHDIAQQLVNNFAQHYTVYHIRREDQLPLQNTIPVQADFRSIAVLIAISAKRLFIDSFCQHLAAALDLESVVTWIVNTPEQFGYEMHTNIIANPQTRKPELKFAQFTPFNIGGNPLEFPYNNEGEIFNVQSIGDAVINTPKPQVTAPLQVPVALSHQMENKIQPIQEPEDEKNIKNGKTKKEAKTEKIEVENSLNGNEEKE